MREFLGKQYLTETLRTWPTARFPCPDDSIPSDALRQVFTDEPSLCRLTAAVYAFYGDEHFPRLPILQNW